VRGQAAAPENKQQEEEDKQRLETWKAVLRGYGNLAIVCNACAMVTVYVIFFLSIAPGHPTFQQVCPKKGGNPTSGRTSHPKGVHDRIEQVELGSSRRSLPDEVLSFKGRRARGRALCGR
jgi:hypothetical protein